MPKIVQDVLPPKTIRRVTLPKREVARKTEKSAIKEFEELHKKRNLRRPPKRERKNPILVWTLTAIVPLILLFALLTVFSHASVTLVPRQESVNLNSEFTASKKAATSAVPYEVIAIEKQETVLVAGTTDKKVGTKATGTIIIYNNYSATPQKLVANTRFSNLQGLIFRLTSPVTIPGKKTVTGTVVPGSVEAKIIAEEPGEKYNVGLADFAIPGFKGTAKYGAIFARSKTSVAGGFVGTVKVASQEKIDKALSLLGETMRADLVAEALSKKSDKLVLVKNSGFYEESKLPNVEGTNGTTVGKKISANFILFSRKSLADAIVKKTLPQSVSETITFNNLGDAELRIATSSDKTALKPWQKDSFTFRLNGKLNALWLPPKALIQKELSGKKRLDLESILSRYPSIEKAEVIVRPFWVRTFPKADRIRIAVEDR